MKGKILLFLFKQEKNPLLEEESLHFSKCHRILVCVVFARNQLQTFVFPKARIGFVNSHVFGPFKSSYEKKRTGKDKMKTRRRKIYKPQ